MFFNVTILQNIIFDYVKEPFLNICPNINFSKPAADGLCQQNCKSFYPAVNQMQVSSANQPCDRHTCNF